MILICYILKEKYGKIYEGKDFINKKNKTAIIEGNAIYGIKPITKLKGTIIVKRVGIIKCFIRAVKRDYPNKYFLNLEIEKNGKILGRLFRLKNIVKTRKNVFKLYHEIENIIEELENIE